jgi:esterase/lipase
MGLASAGTKFTLRQMQNAITVFTDSQSVLNNVRDSLDNISSAMTNVQAEADSPSEPQPARIVFNGRKV